MCACFLQMFFSLGNAYFHLGRLAEAEDAFVMVTLIPICDRKCKTRVIWWTWSGHRSLHSVWRLRLSCGVVFAVLLQAMAHASQAARQDTIVNLAACYHMEGKFSLVGAAMC